MKPLAYQVTLVPLVCVLLVGCASRATPEAPAPAAAPTGPATAAPTSAPTEQPAELGPPENQDIVGEVPSDLLADIKADLAGRLGIEAEAIELVQAEAVTWPDGSLGCPEPGMFYTQALVEGYRVILRAGGEEYDYRAAEQGYFKLCITGG